MKPTINWEQEALKAINAVADGLGQGTEHFYPILVRQQVIDGCFEAFLCIVIPFLLISTTGFCFFKSISANDDSFKFSEITGVLGAISFIYCLISFIHLAIHNPITKIFNPEYHALMDILELLK